MKIVSYNVNGIRAALKKGLAEWIKNENPDIICFQETKAHMEQVDVTALEEMGYYHDWFSAQKKGYSGVATFSKVAPVEVIQGMENDKYDNEGRVLTSVFEDFAILNCYFPSGSSGDERHAFKMDYLNDFLPFIQDLKKEFPSMIVLGDYNVVHLDLDIHNPQRRDLPSGFRPEERAWMDQWFDTEFNDAYRTLHPDQNDMYSWWSYRAGARGNNKGWRIDYISVTDNLKGKLRASRHAYEAVHSDHCPVIVEFKL